jgi:hypothetical protein
MRESDRVQLLSGPYTPPALKRGDRTSCLFRDADVVITSWTAAPISWPRCRRLGRGGGGSGLLVTEELVRAIRTESGKALQHWFGISEHRVWSWRKAFGVSRCGTEGSRRLHGELSERGAEATRGQKQSAQHVLQRVLTRRAYGVKPPNRWAETGRKPEELALLGTLPDEELARRTGRTANAVRLARTRREIPAVRDGRTRRYRNRC